MEQGTENTTPVDAGVTQESGEITEAQLREMLAEMDGIKTPKVEEVAQEAKPEEPKAQTQIADGDSSAADKSEQNKEKATTPTPDVQDKVEAKETKELPKDKGGASESVDKTDSKFAKDNARLSESWKKLEEEKAVVRRQAEEIRIAKEKAEEAAIKAAGGNSQYSAEELRKFAKDWDYEGKDDLAKEARRMADQVERANEMKKERDDRKMREINDIRQSTARQVLDQNPELKDQNSTLYKAVAGIANSEDQSIRDFINNHPNGLIYAAQIAKMQIAAESAASLKSEVEKLQKENADFKKRLSVGSSSPSKPSQGKKSFEKMDGKEQEDFLNKLVRDYDNGVLTGVI
jgi:hypothetical protein